MASAAKTATRASQLTGNWGIRDSVCTNLMEQSSLYRDFSANLSAPSRLRVKSLLEGVSKVSLRLRQSLPP